MSEQTMSANTESVSRQVSPRSSIPRVPSVGRALDI